MNESGVRFSNCAYSMSCYSSCNKYINDVFRRLNSYSQEMNTSLQETNMVETNDLYFWYRWLKVGLNWFLKLSKKIVIPCEIFWEFQSIWLIDFIWKLLDVLMYFFIWEICFVKNKSHKMICNNCYFFYAIYLWKRNISKNDYLVFLVLKKTTGKRRNHIF